MILTVDFNPVFVETYSLKNFSLALDNPYEKEKKRIDASCLDLNRLLGKFNLKTDIMSFLNDQEEIDLRAVIGDITLYSIKSSDQSLKRIEIIDKKNISSLSSPKKRIKQAELISFINNYHSIIDAYNYIVVFDSLNEDKDLIKKLIKISQIKKKTFILTTNRQELLDKLVEMPDLVIIDEYCLLEATRFIPKSIEEYVYNANELYSRGFKKLAINLYEKGIIYMDQEGLLFLRRDMQVFRSSSNLGLVAGLLIGLKNSMDRRDTSKLMAAYNQLHNTYSIDEVNFKLVQDEMDKFSSSNI